MVAENSLGRIWGELPFLKESKCGYVPLNTWGERSYFNLIVLCYRAAYLFLD